MNDSTKLFAFVSLIFLLMAIALAMARSETHSTTMKTFAASADAAVANVVSGSSPTTASSSVTTDTTSTTPATSNTATATAPATTAPATMPPASTPAANGSMHSYAHTFTKFAQSPNGQKVMMLYLVISAASAYMAYHSHQQAQPMNSPSFKGYPVTQAVYHDLKNVN